MPLRMSSQHLDNRGLVEQDAGNEELPGVPKELLLDEAEGRLRGFPQRRPWVACYMLPLLLLHACMH